MSTYEQVADLQPGDVVEVRNPSYTDVVVRGPLHEDRGGSLWLAAYVVRFPDGVPGMPDWPLTVVSRAPRSLYVNHPRTEPVPGDVARDDQTSEPGDLWYWWNAWWTLPGVQAGNLVQGRTLRLLVDGETGQVVP